MAKHLKKVMDEENIVCTQSHCTQTFTYSMDKDLSCRHFRDMVRSLEMCSILGTDKCVVHAIEAPEGENYFDFNLGFFGELEKYARKFGVKILVENSIMPPKHPGEQYPSFFKTPKEMSDFIKKINSPFVKTVVDVGHANCLGVDPAEYIRSLDNQTLLALHLHDNYGHDWHNSPFDGKIDWDSVLKALADIDYQGDMNLELEYYLRRTKELVFPCLKYRAEVGRYMIEEFRKHVIKNLQEKYKKEKETLK